MTLAQLQANVAQILATVELAREMFRDATAFEDLRREAVTLAAITEGHARLDAIVEHTGLPKTVASRYANRLVDCRLVTYTRATGWTLAPQDVEDRKPRLVVAPPVARRCECVQPWEIDKGECAGCGRLLPVQAVTRRREAVAA